MLAFKSTGVFSGTMISVLQQHQVTLHPSIHSTSSRLCYALVLCSLSQLCRKEIRTTYNEVPVQRFPSSATPSQPDTACCCQTHPRGARRFIEVVAEHPSPSLWAELVVIMHAFTTGAIYLKCDE